MNKVLFPDVFVDGEAITGVEIAAEAQNHHAPKGKPGLAWRKAARALAIRKLLLQEAARQGVSAVPREVSPGKFETADEAAIRVLLEDAIVPIKPTDEAIGVTYEKRKEGMRAPSLYEPAHILFLAPPDDADARELALKKAQAALMVLSEKPDQFDRLARQESDCPSRDAGGRLGQISSGDTVPEFEAALDALTPGSIADAPIASRYSYHVIRLDAVAKGAVLPLEAVRSRISEALEKAAWADVARKYVDRLGRAAEITGIDLEFSL